MIMLSENDIRDRAYQISLRYPDNTPEQNWQEAEEQIKQETGLLDMIHRGECGL